MKSPESLSLFLLVITTTSGIISQVSSGKILFYWGVSGYSHRISVWPLMEKLVEKGHHVTFFSPYPSRNPDPNSRIVDIVPKNLSRDLGLATLDFVQVRLEKGHQGVSNLWYEYYQSALRGCISIMKDPQVISWIKSSSYDLIVIDTLFNDCGYGLVDYFKAPHIHYSPSSHFPWMQETYGYPDENAPEMQYFYPMKMSFFQRVKNLLHPLYWRWIKYYDMFPMQEALMKKYLDLPQAPNFDEIEKNVSLVLVNSHHILEFPRSLPPLFVDIGGIHCRDEVKPLPQDVQEFIDSSGTKGFIYLSFGTYLTLGNMPKHLQDIFLNTMSKIDTNFLIKFEGEIPQGLSKNIKPINWISQQDVLASKNIRGFISHGGLLGTQEALFHQVPMIYFPIFAEQDYNALRAQERGTGITLEISGLTEAKLEFAIKEILYNEKYKETTLRISNIFKDRINKPIDTALWWVEYIMRYNGSVNLRPIRSKDTWYERRMLDIFGFLALIALGSFTLIFLIIYNVIKYLLTIIDKKNNILKKAESKKIK